jgi:hypothetical protein
VIRTGGDHHILSRETAVVGRQLEAFSGKGEAIDCYSGADRKVEMLGILLQVVGDSVLGGIQRARPWEGLAWEAVIAGGGEQTKRVPPVPPNVPDPLVCIQDEKWDSPTAQVVAHGQTGLTRPDDNRLHELEFPRHVIDRTRDVASRLSGVLLSRQAMLDREERRPGPRRHSHLAIGVLDVGAGGLG